MTNREAIEVIKLAQAQVEWEYSMDYATAFDMAFSALEKQIPKKPKSVFCPQCGEEFTDDDCWSSDYCRNCGQAIDWEGE